MKRIILYLLMLMLLSACAKPPGAGETFDRSSRGLRQALRWQDYQAVASFFAGEQRQQVIDLFEGVKDLHVVEADYRFNRLHAAQGTAESELILKYYVLPSTRVRQWKWKIDWVMAATGDQSPSGWQIKSPPPTFP